MIQRFSTNFGVFSIFLDLIITSTSLYISKIVRPHLDNILFIKPIWKPVDVPITLFFIFPLIWVGILFFFSVYDGKKNLKVTDEFTSLTLGSLLSVVTLSGVLYLSYREIPRALFVFFVVLTFLIMLLWRVLARTIYQKRMEEKGYKTRVLVIGAGPVGRNLREKLNSLDPTTYNFVGYLDDSPQVQKENPEVIGTLNQMVSIIKQEKVNHIFIALPRYAHEKIAQVTEQLETLPVRVSVIPDYFYLTVHHTSISEFAGLPILDMRAPALTEMQRLTKRFFDIFFTTLIMIPVLPMILFISLLILIFDGRPIFFIQNRVGENGQLFKFYKFRTMKVGAEKMNAAVAIKNEKGEMIIKRKNDPRVTTIGRFLRRFSLDELPQFFNILRGTMSLVGPRPELPELVKNYQPWQRARFSIPQGLTGWWQIHGRSDRPMHLNTEDDLYYIEHYSIWMDFSILIRTFWIIFRGKGAY
jgi:exopolysaccharide biosynthesis polyprenyl glycosylphosphotransferase